MAKESKTPLLDQLEEGPWPSFVKEIKRAAQKKDSAKDLLGQLERSYNDRIGHWKHGGIVGVKGYGGGVIGRYSDLPEEFPAIAEFHTFRVNMPSAWFYTTDKLRKLCDVWDKHGSGLTNMHGGHAIVCTARNLDLGFVGEHRPVQFILEFQGNFAQQIQGVNACKFAAGRPYTAGGRAHVAARTAQVEADVGQVIKTGLQFFCGSAKQDNVAGSSVHVG